MITPTGHHHDLQWFLQSIAYGQGVLFFFDFGRNEWFHQPDYAY